MDKKQSPSNGESHVHRGEFAHLEKDVVLVGVGSRIEIWNKAVWNEKNVYDDMEEIAENMEGLGI